MKKVYALPLPDGRTVRVRVGTELEIDDELSTIMWVVDSDGIQAHAPGQVIDVTENLLTTLADITDMPKEAAEPFIRMWLALRLNVPYNEAIEVALERALPNLRKLYQHHAGIARIANLSPRLYAALRAGETPRDIAASYWADESSRSDGMALVQGLRVNDKLDESRVALMNLVPPGDHRRHLAEVETAATWFVPGNEVADVAAELNAPVALEFAKSAIRDPRSRLQLSAARALRIRAVGNNGALAYRNLLDAVLRSQFAAPRTLAERAIAAGPVAGLPIAQVVTAAELRTLARAARNCLANPAYPWHGRVLRGEVSLLTLGEAGNLAAIVAVDPTTGAVLEARGKGNAAVSPALVSAVEAHLATVTKVG